VPVVLPETDPYLAHLPRVAHGPLVDANPEAGA
jgi:hypothetical protein